MQVHEFYVVCAYHVWYAYVLWGSVYSLVRIDMGLVFRAAVSPYCICSIGVFRLLQSRATASFMMREGVQISSTHRLRLDLALVRQVP